MNRKKNLLFSQGSLLVVIAVIAAVISLAKESIFAKCFGVSGISDAYTIAMQVPEMIFAVVWETIHAVVIPLYTDKLYKTGKEGAQKFFSNILTLVCILAACFIICGEILSNYIITILFPGIAEETRSLAVSLLRLVFPVLFFEGIIRVVTSVLHVHNQFVIPRMLSTVRNIGVIVCLFLLSKQLGVYAAILGFIVGMILESAVCMLVNNKYERYIPCLDLQDPALRTVATMAVPLLVGVGVRELNQVVDKIVSSFFSAGSISALHYASKLSSMIEVTLLGNIVLLLYPRYSTLAAEDNKEELVGEYVKTIDICLLLGIPIIFGGIFLRKEIVAIAFQGGAFDNTSVVIVSLLFSVYLASSIFTAINGASVKLFTACCDTKTPSVNAVVGIAVNIVMNIVLSFCFGVVGLTIATLISSVIMCIRLFLLVRKKVFKFSLGGVVLTSAKCLAAGLFMYLGLLFFKSVASNYIQVFTLTGYILYCLLSVLVGMFTYMLSLLFMKVKVRDICSI